MPKKILRSLESSGSNLSKSINISSRIYELGSTYYAIMENEKFIPVNGIVEICCTSNKFLYANNKGSFSDNVKSIVIRFCFKKF